MGRKSSSTAVSKVSSGAAPAVSSVTASNQKSSVLKSAFAPSQFQLRLFASVIQSFDTQQLRIHDINNGRLRCQHESGPGTRITSLDWGYYGPAYREQRQTSPKKKRKRDHDPSESAVVAYGTSSSDINLFSPAEGKVVGILTGVHQRGIKDFKFSPPQYSEGWSIGEDGKLVQWDLTKGQATRTISLPDPAIDVLAIPSIKSPQLLCASSTPFAYTIQSAQDFQIDRYDSFKNAIHSLVRSESAESSSDYFLAADTDRYMNIYDVPQKRLVRTLVVGSGVVAVDLSTASQESTGVSSQQLLLAVAKDGTVELFFEPFTMPKQINGNLKSSRKNMAKKATAQVRLVSPDGKSKQLSICAASLQGPDLVIVSADGSVDLTFQKIRWQDEGNGELLFDGVKEVVKTKSASTLNTATLNGVKDMGQSQIDESKTVVVNGAAGGPHSEAIEILSSESDGEDSVDEDDIKEESSEAEEGDDEEASDQEMADADDIQEDKGEDEEMANTASDHESTAEEPSFGEILASKHPGTISIADTLAPAASKTPISGRDGIPTIPSGMSLGTVLTQSLRTNDQNLLEACLHTLDINIVKNTIQRLDSSLAGVLLSKLAERLASRPGRYGHLITWVQWTCIAHGGAIAAQPDVAAKVRTLYQVLTQRSKTLDNLLLLKGKLDMLDAQLTFRKQLAAQRPPRRDDQDEPGMIYIEGEDNWDSSDEDDLDEDISRPLKKLAQGRGRGKATKRALEDVMVDDDSSEDEELLPLENGAADSDEDESEDDESDAELAINGQVGGLLDDEVEVSGAEESDPDDEDEGRVNGDSSSSTDSSSNDDEEHDEEDEEDSEMDDFINDGSISVADDEDDVDIPGDESEKEEEHIAPAPPARQPKRKLTKSKPVKLSKHS